MMETRIAYLFVSFFLGWFFLAGPCSAEDKTLQRTEDPVVIECGDFSGLFGSPADRLTLMIMKDGEWLPIPFQVDEKKPDSSYAFTDGPEAGPDPETGIDANDELVFMAKDTGHRADDEALPEGALAGVEIEITDPKTDEKGWAYLLLFSGDAPRSKDDYIRLEIDERNRIRRVITYESLSGQGYVMGGGVDRIYPDYLAARELPNGAQGLDVLDWLKMRGEAVLPWGITIPFYFDDWVKAEDRGWIDGPVRVLLLADTYLEITSFIKVKGYGYSLVSYYVNHVIWPMKMDIPSNWMPLVKKVSFRGFMDFNTNVYGSCSFNNANPYNRDVILDGRMSEAEKNIDTDTPIDWIAGFGPQGAMLSRLVFVPEGNVAKHLYYLDDETVKDPPEDHPGVSGVGYSLVGIEKGGTRGAMSYQYYYYVGELAPQGVYSILDILDHPLDMETREIGSPIQVKAIEK